MEVCIVKIVVVKSPKILAGFLRFLFKIKDEEK
ncbi:MAG: stage V sporulation protein SpoVM [Oscillospiraceae bacterium]